MIVSTPEAPVRWLDRHLSFDGVSVPVGDPRFDYLPAAERDSQMDALFAGFVRDTAARCSLVGANLRRRGISFETVRKPADLGDFLLGKNTLAAVAPEALLPDTYAGIDAGGLGALPPEDRIGKTFSSSGSTGRVAEIYYTAGDWLNAVAAIVRCMHHLPTATWSRIFSGFHQGHVAGKVFEDGFNAAGAVVKNRHFASRDDAESLEQIRRCRSNALAVPAENARVNKGGDLKTLLALDTDNLIGRQIEVVITTSAPRPDAIIEQVHRRNEQAGVGFRTRFVDFAGCAEVLPTVAECEFNCGLHLIPGVTLVEVLDPATLRHVRPGERGLLIYTGLKHGSRFIRYIVGDEATYIDEPCACGRTTPRLQGIRRVADVERFEDGCGAWR